MAAMAAMVLLASFASVAHSLRGEAFYATTASCVDIKDVTRATACRACTTVACTDCTANERVADPWTCTQAATSELAATSRRALLGWCQDRTNGVKTGTNSNLQSNICPNYVGTDTTICRDTATDVNNCGGCEIKCASGQICKPFDGAQYAPFGSCVAGPVLDCIS